MSSSSWYESTREASAIPEQVAQRAVEWLVELQEPEISAERVETWRRWRAEHPDHERAWRRIETVNGMLNRTASPARSILARATLAPPRSPARRRAVKTLSVLIYTGGLAWAAEEHLPWRKWSADVRTGVGEQRLLALGDGTQIVLNTDSAIDVRFNGTQRRLRLVSGEILVTTARDPHSPARAFAVETPQGLATPLGTRFTVGLQDGATSVGVFQGAVRLEPGAMTEPALVLQAGQQGSFSPFGVQGTAALDRDSAAWSEGFIVAKNRRLGDFLQELNRYTDASLSCDPSVAATLVSGSYSLGDIGVALETLALALHLHIQRQRRFWGDEAIRLMPPGSNA